MNKEHNKKVGKRVKELYKSHGMTQAKLAEALGYSDQNTISQIVNGHRSLTPEAANTLVRMFPEVSLDWLLGRSDYKNEGDRLMDLLLSNEVKLKSFEDAFNGFLCNTGYFLLTPETFQKHGDPSSPSNDYVLFKGDAQLVLSRNEVIPLFELVRANIKSQIDFLFDTKARHYQDRVLAELLDAKVEQKSHGEANTSSKGAI